jgi:hypothetical protein
MYSLNCTALRASLSVALNCQSQSYVTTDGQSASLSWNKAPIWVLRPDLYYCQTAASLLMWGALSDVRKSLSFASARTPRKTRPLLLRSADRIDNTTHVVPIQRVHRRADCCLATSYKHPSYCCVFTISLSSNGNISPIAGQNLSSRERVYLAVP